MESSREISSDSIDDEPNLHQERPAPYDIRCRTSYRLRNRPLLTHNQNERITDISSEVEDDLDCVNEYDSPTRLPDIIPEREKSICDVSQQEPTVSTPRSNREPSQMKHMPPPSQFPWGKCAWLLLIPVIISAYFVGRQFTPQNNEANTDTRKKCNFDLVKTEFPTQESLTWKALSHGVESVLNDNPTKPSIFMLAYKDSHTAAKLVNRIIEITKTCMNTKYDPLLLTERDFSLPEMRKDYGIALTTYGPELTKRGVLLVSDVNKISGNVAQAFHSICDVYTPLVARAVIFMTMHIHSMPHAENHLLELVENQLRTNWSQLPENVLQPLVARVTDQVLLLKSEN